MRLPVCLLMSRPALALFALLVVLSAQTLGQQTPGGPTFEVASVKRNTSGESGGSSNREGNMVVIRNYPLRTIIQQAYNLRRYQLAGGPDWIQLNALRHCREGTGGCDRRQQDDARAVGRPLQAEGAH